SKTSFAKLVPIWIANAPRSAASAGQSRALPATVAAAVPTATGTNAAVSVAGRAARIQARSDPGGGRWIARSFIVLPPRGWRPARPAARGRDRAPRRPPRRAERAAGGRG